MKNKMSRLLVLAAAAVTIGFFANNVSAQGNFDPAEFRERQMKRYRDDINVKSDEDWKKIEGLIDNVLAAQRDARMGTGGFGNRGGGGGRRGGEGADASNTNRNRFGGQPVPEVDALKKALDEKAPADEVTAKLAKVREVRKVREAALDKAQEALRKALSPRQEAGAVMAGLLK
jgi:hypothetical protein